MKYQNNFPFSLCISDLYEIIYDVVLLQRKQIQIIFVKAKQRLVSSDMIAVSSNIIKIDLSSKMLVYCLFLLKFKTIINIFKLTNIMLYELFHLKNKTITNKFKLSNIFLV